MTDLKPLIRDVADFPRSGILFRDIAPLLRDHFEPAVDALSALLSAAQWERIEAVAGIESRGFILAAALATRHRKGFVPLRKQGKLPPPVVARPYDLEYGSGILEMQRGHGQLLLVDDVLATGGTLAAGAHLCVAAGYEVAHLMALIDLKLTVDFRWRGLRPLCAVHY